MICQSVSGFGGRPYPSPSVPVRTLGCLNSPERVFLIDAYYSDRASEAVSQILNHFCDYPGLVWGFRSSSNAALVRGSAQEVSLLHFVAGFEIIALPALPAGPERLTEPPHQIICGPTNE